MEDSKTFLVITAIVNKQNIAEVPEYLGSVMKIFGQNGGKPVGRYKKGKVYDRPYGGSVIGESDSKDGVGYWLLEEWEE